MHPYKRLLPSVRVLSIKEYFKMDEGLFFKKVSKNYTHIDYPLSRNESNIFLQNLNDFQTIKQHRFLPMIQFDIKFKKHPTPEKTVNIKKRGISLVSHHDAGIYAFLAEKLNSKYNDYSIKNNISESSVAYRDYSKSKKKISNITVAKEVFDFIDFEKDSWVIKGDFKGFFDNLNHNVLNRNTRKVLGLKHTSLELDTWMKVLKNIERYVYIEKSQLLNELNHQIVRRKGKTAYFKSIENFGQFVKRNKYLLKKNQKKGIPQGTSISAVLANVYMIDFDKKVCALLKNLGGMYRRYSDDFIIVIPKEKVSCFEFSNIFKKIISLSSTLLHLDIEEEKTRRLSINYGMVKDLQKETCSAPTSSLDYLGFIYQNNTVSFRGKTIYKFYYRGRRALESASAGKEVYDVITKYLKGDYKVSDDAAKNVLAILYPSGMSASEKQRNINKIKRIMYLRKANSGLPELKHSYQSYLMKIDNALPRKSFLSYIKTANQIFSQGQHSYKVSIMKQSNKVRNRLLTYKRDYQKEYPWLH